MQRGKQEILRLAAEIRREIQFDTFNLTRSEQDRAEHKLQEFEDAVNELYRGKNC